MRVKHAQEPDEQAATGGGVPLGVPHGVETGPVERDPLALAQALLTQAETAADPAPLLAAARVLIREAQQADDAKRGTGS